MMKEVLLKLQEGSYQFAVRVSVFHSSCRPLEAKTAKSSQTRFQFQQKPPDLF